jgi:hypothetical protein
MNLKTLVSKFSTEQNSVVKLIEYLKKYNKH